jgi:hypothetical protein
MTHHNQIKKLTTWFLNLPLNESIDNKKHKVWSLNPKPHESLLEDEKTKKWSRMWSRRRKNRSPTKARKVANQAKWQRRAKKSQTQKLPLNQTFPNTLNATSPP